MIGNTRVPGPVDEPVEGLDGERNALDFVTSETVNEERVAGPVVEQTENIEDEPGHDKGIDSPPNIKSYGAWIVIVFGLSWLSYLLIDGLASAFGKGWLVFTPLFLVSVLFSGFMGWVLFKEWRAQRNIDQVKMVREAMQNSKAETSSYLLKENLAPLLENFREIYPKQMESFDAEAKNRDSVDSYVSLLDNLVLSHADKLVDAEIKKASLSVAAMVVASPHPVLDAAMVIIRASMMIKEIGRLYGLQSTRWSSIKLLRYIMISAITAAAVEEIASTVIEDLGLGMAGKVSKLAAESLVGANRMYRLGQLTKTMIRPIPVR